VKEKKPSLLQSRILSFGRCGCHCRTVPHTVLQEVRLLLSHTLLQTHTVPHTALRGVRLLLSRTLLLSHRVQHTVLREVRLLLSHTVQHTVPREVRLLLITFGSHKQVRTLKRAPCSSSGTRASVQCPAAAVVPRCPQPTAYALIREVRFIKAQYYRVQGHRQVSSTIRQKWHLSGYSIDKCCPHPPLTPTYVLTQVRVSVRVNSRRQRSLP
jgi:hypothetical protein